MSSNGPFGFDPEEFDRVAREAGEGLRDALDGISRFFTTSGERAPWATIFDEFSRYTRPRNEPETTGETGDGVWTIYTVDDEVAPTSRRCIRPNWMRSGRTRATPIRRGRSASCRTASRSACLTRPKWATVVDPARLMAGVDCGFSIHVGMQGIDPDVAWAKLTAMAEGCRIASRRLFGR